MNDTGLPEHERTARLRISVAWSPRQRQVQTVQLMVAPGTTVDQALAAAGLAAKEARKVAIWGRAARLDEVVADGDRIEFCRPLLVDPKVARRQRFQRQGVKTAGLFAQRRPGSKPGY